MDEQQLIEKAIEKDPRAQAELVLRYQDKVFNLALRMMRDHEDAEDVLQETFLTALRMLHTFEGRSQLFTWLYRITMNISLQKLREKKKYLNNVSLSDPDFDSIYGHRLSEWPKFSRNAVDDKEFKILLDQALNKLPPMYRSVFILRDLEGLSTLETQKLLDLTESNVKVRLMRARVFLREELKEYFKVSHGKTGQY